MISPLEIKSPRGLVIQVGRNHRQNEWISLKKAKPGDIWFHAQECPGSHVVLKTSAGFAEVDDIQVAADLAAFFSKAKLNQHVPIVLVPTEQLKRIPGSMPGTVRYRKCKVMWANPSNGKKYFSVKNH